MFMFFTDANENTDIHHACDILLVSIAGVFAIINISSCFISSGGPLFRKMIGILRAKYYGGGKKQAGKESEKQTSVKENHDPTAIQDHHLSDQYSRTDLLEVSQAKPDSYLNQLFDETSGNTPFKANQHNENYLRQENNQGQSDFWEGKTQNQCLWTKEISKKGKQIAWIDEYHERFPAQQKANEHLFRAKISTIDHGQLNNQKKVTNWAGAKQNKQIYMLRQQPSNRTAQQSYTQENSIFKNENDQQKFDIWEN
ncbi:hypothetical protein FGO68_gene5514 [Halteria grandinella]|uniref:Uncharacterized protein n=1 Tax=Halteria grandinella TaxID=5974 RepID=A0A8J8NDX3_HALGN|nr:hypothetical protein FGO68_gene5514 [Halteria grandinella]